MIMLEEISKKIAYYLGLDEQPIEFDKISDDSMLVAKGTVKIVINEIGEYMKFNYKYSNRIFHGEPVVISDTSILFIPRPLNINFSFFWLKVGAFL